MAEKKILCIEDNRSNMLLVARIVEAEKHQLLQATDGRTALALLDTERPDLILLDINIPGISGLELARIMKSRAELQDIPLIATTANVLVGDRERCLQAGCDEYLPKPLDIRALQGLIRHYLSNGTAAAVAVPDSPQ